MFAQRPTQLASRWIGLHRIRFAAFIIIETNRAMALTKTDRVESLFNEFGLHNRKARDVVDLCFEEKRSSQRVDEASNDVDKSGGGLSHRALTHRASLAVAG